MVVSSDFLRVEGGSDGNVTGPVDPPAHAGSRLFFIQASEYNTTSLALDYIF